MNIFHRQGDISSDTPEDGDAPERGQEGHSSSPSLLHSAHAGQDDEEISGPSDRSTRSSASILIADLQNGRGIDVGASINSHRDGIFASLLEEHYRTHVAERLNALNLGRNFTRESPEVRAVAHDLFRRGGQYLSEAGVLDSSVVSDHNSHTRAQYMANINRLTSSFIQSHDLIQPMRDLAIQPAASAPGTLVSDSHLGRRSALSHYQSNFKETKLLGKGGFGKVFGCFNVLDQRMYAVKKIQLSKKFAVSAAEGNHEEMEELLREVKALARLEHVNVVRYHATWIEQPQQAPTATDDVADLDSVRAITTGPGQRRLLLDTRPFNMGPVYEPSFSDRPEDTDMGKGISFSEDTPLEGVEEDPRTAGSSQNLSSFRISFEDDSHPPRATEEFTESEKDKSGLSEKSAPGDESTETHSEENTSELVGDSIFSDGRVDNWSNAAVRPRNTPDPSRPILYIQMSLYPMTLAQYIALPNPQNPHPVCRHCFHLAPTLQLTLAILDGLQYIHGSGLIHRDIKPSNIFLSKPEVVFRSGYSDVSCQTCSRDGKPFTRFLNPRIGDFGLVAQLASEGLIVEEKPGATARAHKHVGTIPYCPPIWNGDGDSNAGGNNSAPRPDDGKTDIYALGVAFLEMLWEFTTKMERDQVLKGDLQKNILSSGLRGKLEGEGFDALVVKDVLALAMSMVDPNPAKRWHGDQVRNAIKSLLDRI